REQGRALALPVGHPGGQLVTRHGAGDEVALGEVAVGGAQETPVVLVLHPLGDGHHPQLPGHAEAAFEDGAQGIVLPGAVHEAAVDLELVEGDVPQLHQGRVAGAEVVDGQADVLEPEAGEDIQGGDAVAHQPALGDFQHQPRQGHRVAGGGGGDEVGKLQRRQVVHRQVDGDVELEVPGTPLPHLGKGHRQHLAGEVVDQAVVLGEANELIGPHQPVHGVLPAHQGLDPHDVAAGEVYHRLVVIDQLATGDAPGQ